MEPTASLPARPGAPGRFLPFLLVLFIGSGCAALIYEIVWLQLLALVVGSTAISLGVLLGTFMGGMCLGSYLLPRFISRDRHPLRVYAALELCIGIIGVIVLQAMPFVANAYTAFAGGGWTGIMVRAIVAGICLLPPTLLMGATLPAIARWIETTKEGVSWLGFFYGGNIAGAVFGCLWAGFYLLRVHDMAYATYCALGINLAVALLATLVSGIAEYKPARSNSQHSSSSQKEMDPWAWLVYVTIAFSGMTALAAEVIWTRLLSLMLGMTVYAFSNILAVFLIGLGIGSSVGAMIARTSTRPRLALGVCQILLAAGCAWAAYSIAYSLPYWPINPSLAVSPWYTFQIDLARCFWVVLPSAILWGASFPLALAAVAQDVEDPGRLVGGVYAANTIGAIVGSLAFSMLIVPGLGTQWAQQILIGLCGFSSLFMLIPACVGIWKARGAERAQPSVRGSLALFASLIGVAGLMIYVGPVPWISVAFGRFSADPNTTNVTDPLHPRPDDRTSLYVGEGMNVSVCVTQLGEYRYFHGAGKVQASSWPQDMHLQRMLGDLSALIAKKNDDVLVVACGAGVTAGSFIPYPTVKHITICDIEPLVPHNVAAKFFEKENYGVVDSPRTTVVIDDGRHFVRTTKQKFDVITSDPIDPWVKGCASLNTVEYYQMCRDHLNPGGVVSLWIPLYESKLESAKSLITTFFQVFPNGIIFSNDTKGEGYDAVLLGTVDPVKIDITKVQALLDSPPYAGVKASLRDVGIGTSVGGDEAVDLMATYAGRAADLGPWMKEAIDAGNINTDSNLRLQYLAGMWLNNYEQTEILQDMLKYYSFPKDIFTGSDQHMTMFRQTLENEGRARFAGSAAAQDAAVAEGPPAK